MKCKYPDCNNELKPNWKFCPAHPTYQFIMARDESGKLYSYGTNPGMDKLEEYNRFKHCDLSRYPVGKNNGYENDVTIIETSCPIGVDEAMRLFMGQKYVSPVFGNVTVTPYPLNI